jgi:hypothetical protein
MTDDRLAKDSESNRERASGTAFKSRGGAIFSGFLLGVLGGLVSILVVIFLRYRARVREAGRARSPAGALQKLRGYKPPVIDQRDLVTFPIAPEKEGTAEPHGDD